VAQKHTISIVIGKSQIDEWTEYEIESSMVSPADSFTLTRPFDAAAYRLCELDSRVRIRIDGVPVLDGFIDEDHPLITPIHAVNIAVDLQSAMASSPRPRTATLPTSDNMSSTTRESFVHRDKRALRN